MTTQEPEQNPFGPHEIALSAIVHYLRCLERVNWKLTDKRLEKLEEEMIELRLELQRLKQ